MHFENRSQELTASLFDAEDPEMRQERTWSPATSWKSPVVTARGGGVGDVAAGRVKCGRPEERVSLSPLWATASQAGDASGGAGGGEGCGCAAQLAVEDSQPRPAPRLSCPGQHMASAAGQERRGRRGGRTLAAPAQPGGPGEPRRGPQGRRLDGARAQGRGGQLGAGQGAIRAGRAGRGLLAPPRDRPHIGRGAGGGVKCSGCRRVRTGAGPAAPRLLQSAGAHLAPSDPRRAAGPGMRSAPGSHGPLRGRAGRPLWGPRRRERARGGGAGVAGGPGPGGCSRASGSSTSSRSHSTCADPWRCTTPSRSSSASPSTARSSSSARTTSSCKYAKRITEWPYPAGRRAGWGPGPPEVAGTGTGRGFRHVCASRGLVGGLGRRLGAVRPHAAPSGHDFPGLERVRSGERRIGSLGEEGAGRIRALSGAPRVRACLCFSVSVCVVVVAAAARDGVGAGRSPCPQARPFSPSMPAQSAWPAWRAPEGESVSV